MVLLLSVLQQRHRLLGMLEPALRLPAHILRMGKRIMCLAQGCRITAARPCFNGLHGRLRSLCLLSQRTVGHAESEVIGSCQQRIGEPFQTLLLSQEEALGLLMASKDGKGQGLAEYQLKKAAVLLGAC